MRESWEHRGEMQSHRAGRGTKGTEGRHSRDHRGLQLVNRHMERTERVGWALGGH